MRSSRLLPGLLLSFCLCAAQARGEFYRWTDAHGREHITDDLSQVPPAQRPRPDEVPAAPGGSRTRWNEIEVKSPAYRRSAPRKSVGPQRGRTHRIGVERAGTSLTVRALLDGRTTGLFKVDTGAEMNMIPAHVVDAMGIVIDDKTPTMLVVGISGQPMRLPIIKLREVRVGTALVRNVEMTVNPRSSYGLLGMTFFNHFKVQTDPVAGILTLEEVDTASAEAAGVYGGFGEGYWRREFRGIHRQIKGIRAARKQVPSNHVTVQDRIDEQEKTMRKRLDDLHERASRAGVPRAWRE